jgi:hypothetical protein
MAVFESEFVELSIPDSSPSSCSLVRGPTAAVEAASSSSRLMKVVAAEPDIDVRVPIY